MKTIIYIITIIVVIFFGVPFVFGMVAGFLSIWVYMIDTLIDACKYIKSKL